MPNAIGQPVETYDIYIRRDSVTGFLIKWFKDNAKTVPNDDIDGFSFRVVVGSRTEPVREWTSVAQGNETQFFLSQEDTDLPFNRYDGSIIMINGVEETALVNLRVIVEPD
jgi:hypothetical protein